MHSLFQRVEDINRISRETRKNESREWNFGQVPVVKRTDRWAKVE